MTAGPHPVSTEVAGHSIVLAYASVAAEYTALHVHSALFDRRHRGRIKLTGPKAAEMVAGLVTNDVTSLAPGHGCYAAALTAKGKIVADVRVFVTEDGVLVDAPPRASAAWASMVKKFVNPRLAPHTDETMRLASLGIYGPSSHQVVSTLLGIPAPALAALPEYGHVAIAIDGAPAMVARVPDICLEGFDVFLPAEGFDTLWERAVEAGAMPAGLEAWEIARVEGGRPEWGVDMDENTLPQEVNFDELHAISYTKGCYVGQETVARIHFRGHVNRHLRGVRAAGLEPPPTGATLHDDAGLQVGDVRSAVRSPTLGGIALAMIRREIDPGTALIARWPADGDAGAMIERRVDVAALPFATA